MEKKETFQPHPREESAGKEELTARVEIHDHKNIVASRIQTIEDSILHKSLYQTTIKSLVEKNGGETGPLSATISNIRAQFLDGQSIDKPKLLL